MTKRGEAKLDTFQQKCLRRLLKIQWPMQVSMKRRAKKLSVNKYEEKVDMDWTRATDG